MESVGGIFYDHRISFDRRKSDWQFLFSNVLFITQASETDANLQKYTLFQYDEASPHFWTMDRLRGSFEVSNMAGITGLLFMRPFGIQSSSNINTIYSRTSRQNCFRVSFNNTCNAEKYEAKIQKSFAIIRFLQITYNNISQSFKQKVNSPSVPPKS